MAFLEPTHTISRMMMQRLDDFETEIDQVHMVWLREIKQEAHRMFSGELSTEPELMPKTPSQKRRTRKRRISLGLQEETRTRRRFSTRRRSNLATSVKKLGLVFEEATEPQPSTSSVGVVSLEDKPPRVVLVKAEPVEMDTDMNVPGSPGRAATDVAVAGTPPRPRVSLARRRSAAHSLARQSVRRASRTLLLKEVRDHASSSVCGDDHDEQQPEKQSEAEEAFVDTEQIEQLVPPVKRVTRASLRSAAGSSSSNTEKPVERKSPVKSTRGSQRKAAEHADSSQKNTVLRPNKKTFFQTPNSLGHTAVTKSFLKRATPLKVDTMAKERQKLEALKKKQEQEEERRKKMEEEKKKKQDELKRKREERLRKTSEARAKEEEKEEGKKKKLEQKRALMEEKNDKLRVERLAEEKLKKELALKHQEEIDSRRKLEEETRLKRIQQAEEEKRLQAKRRAEEEAHELAEARRAQEVKKEQERAERERAEALQREVEKAAREERKGAEKRKELEDQRKKEEQQMLADEERAEAAAKMQPLGQSAGLNMTVDVESSIMTTPTRKDGSEHNLTVDVEKSPQTYSITPKGANKTVKLTGNPDDYGMDQKSDDSTDDESAPRKPIPSWAEGNKLQQALLREYFNPPDLYDLFGTILPPNLEEIFYTKKPRFNKRTSSAVWHSPPMGK